VWIAVEVALEVGQVDATEGLRYPERTSPTSASVVNLCRHGMLGVAGALQIVCSPTTGGLSFGQADIANSPVAYEPRSSVLR
jgi:hypothetical protein